MTSGSIRQVKWQFVFRLHRWSDVGLGLWLASYHSWRLLDVVTMLKTATCSYKQKSSGCATFYLPELSPWQQFRYAAFCSCVPSWLWICRVIMYSNFPVTDQSDRSILFQRGCANKYTSPNSATWHHGCLLLNSFSPLFRVAMSSPTLSSMKIQVTP